MAQPQQARPAPPPNARKSNSGCVGMTVGTVIVILVLYGIAAVGYQMAGPPLPTLAAGKVVVTATPAIAAKAAAPTAVAKPTAPPMPTMPPGAVGQVVTDNWQIVVRGVERKATVDSFGQPVKPVGEWLVVSVELVNRGRENFGVNTWDFELRTADGATIKHSTDFGAMAYANSLPDRRALGGQIPPGAKSASALIYDVAPGAGGLTLVFTQAPQQSVRLP